MNTTKRREATAADKDSDDNLGESMAAAAKQKGKAVDSGNKVAVHIKDTPGAAF